MEANLSLHLLQTLMDNRPLTLYFFFLLLFPLLLFQLCTQYFVRRKHALTNLPQTQGLFVSLIGNLHLLRPRPHISFHHLSQKHGDLIRLNLGQLTTIVASSPEIATEILKTQDSNFCSRPSLASTYRYSYGGLDITFSSYNQHWMQLRRFANTHMFSPSKVKSLRAIREQEVAAMVNAISKESASCVNVSDISTCLFNNIMFREVFGKRPTGGDDGERGMRSRYHDLIEEVISFMGEYFWGDLFPSLAWMDVISGRERRLERSFRALDAVLGEEIAEGLKRRDGHEAGRSEDDDGDHGFFDVLLRHLSEDQNMQNDSPGLELNTCENLEDAG